MSNVSIKIDEHKLRTLCASNMTLAKIAKEFKVCRTTIRTKMRELNIKRSYHHPSKLTKEQIKKIQQLEAEGEPYTQISKKLGVHQSTLLRFRKQNSIFKENPELAEKIRKAKKSSAIKGTKTIYNRNKLDPYIDEIIELLEQGHTKLFIAEKYKVCPGTVHNLLNSHGLTIKTKKKLETKEQSVKNLYSRGYSYDKIAQKNNVSVTTVKRRIKNDWTLPNRPVKITSKLSQQETTIKRLYNNGDSLSIIASKVGCSPQWLKIKVKKMGLSREYSQINKKSILDGKENTIKRLLKQNYNIAKIAEKLEVKYTTLFQFALRKGLIHKKTKYNLEQIKTLAFQGMSTSQIAKQLDISQQTVRQAFHKLKITFPERNSFKLSTTHKQIIIDYLNNGLTNKEIAEIFHISTSTLERFKKRIGIK